MSPLLASLLLLAAPAEPAFETVEATGTGYTEDQAKLRALVEAVAQVSGARVASDSKVQKGTMLYDVIEVHVNGMVKGVEVLSVQTEGKLTTVKVRASVLKEVLDSELAAARSTIEMMGRSKLRIAIEEKPGEGTNQHPFADALGKELAADGWKVGLEPADFVLRGRFQLAPKGQHGASAELKLTDAASGAVAGAVLVSTPEEGGLPQAAMDQAVKAAVTKVRLAALDAERCRRVEGTLIDVAVTGVGYGDVEDLERALEKMSGVLAVTMSSSFENETQVYRVSWRGTSDSFAKALGSMTFKKKKLAAVAKGAAKVTAGFRR